MRPTLTLAFVCVVWLCAGLANSAQAQVVYRCGNVYSQSPCPEGKIVDATDPRSAAQRAEARRVAADERRLADEMQRDRLVQQAAQRPAGAASLSPRPPAAVPLATKHRAPKKKRGIHKPESETDFVAVDRSTLKRRGK